MNANKIPLNDPFFTGINTDPVNNEVDYKAILESCKIDPLAYIDKPPTILSIGEMPVATLGNFSLLIGKAKAKKTFLLCSLISGAVKNLDSILNIQGTMPEDKQNVLHFDTEMSEYHLTYAVKRVCRLIDVPDPENYCAYGLRKYNPAERLNIIEWALYHTKNVGLVAIDGLRDLFTRGINDEAEATEVIGKIMKWTAELNIHIILVLHQNKNDDNARGHAGTEAQNKAESVISVTVQRRDKNISTVEAVYCRDKDFEPFSFKIDEDSHLPVLCGTPENTEKKPKIAPEKIDYITHASVLNSIYSVQSEPNYQGLITSIILKFREHKIEFGETKCREFFTYYVDKKWITPFKKGRSTKYSYMELQF